MSKAICFTLVLLMVIVNSGHADSGADAAIKTLPFEDCGSILDVETVRISSCAHESDPCEIPINAIVDVDIGFGNVTWPFKNDEKEEVEHSAQWVLNEIQTDAEVLPNDTDNRMAMMKAALKVGNLVSDIRGTLQWKTLIRDKVAACFIVPVVLVENSSDSETPPLPMPN